MAAPLAGRMHRPLRDRPAVRIARKAPRHRYDHAPQAQQGIEQRLVPHLHELYRTLGRNRHFYLFSDAETMFVAKPAAEAAGFRFWKPLVWDKERIGMGYHYRSRYEFILFFEKGKRPLADLSIPDVISHPRIHAGYPTEKPSAVSKVLIGQSTEPGEIVADPFMGSGSAGVAALSLGRRFIGTDLSPAAVALSTERLRAALP
jgi:site-specific DNA-methyltransferase (adenine-specific)